MGIPYSKQINAAFEEVTPLVAEGFEVLQTTRNITFLLAEIQIITVFMLFSILVALCMLLITCNPDLERERQAIVTPVLRWFAGWVMSSEGKFRIGLVVVLGLVAGGGVGYGHYWAYFLDKKKNKVGGTDEGERVEEAGGKDVERIKEGKADQ